jgi:CubicO group peptidase (beta-lactamase class C family)
MISIIALFVIVNGLTYYFEWHPLRLSLPFTQSQSFEVDFEPFNWNTTSPKEAGLDENSINLYSKEIEDWKRLRALLIVKDGNLIFEKYQRAATAKSAFNVHSITKSITSALIGVAIQKGNIKSENDRALDYFPEYRNQIGMDNSKYKITIADLLTMQGGFTGGDGPQNVKQVVLHEQVSAQNIGNKFQYFTGSHMVLSAILTRSSDLNTKDFADEHLFRDLGIQNAFWRNVDGFYCGGDETYFTPRDLARFGELYLNKGKVGGLQLIDSVWVEKSLSNHVSPETKQFRTLDCYQEAGYGFSWWILNYNDKLVYTARGKGGQYILIIPDHNVVAVIIQEWNLRKDFKIENGFLCKLLSILTD